MALPHQGLKIFSESISIDGHRTGFSAVRGSGHDFRADTLPREDFKEDSVRNTSINNMSFSDPVAQRIQARMNLWDHSLCDRPLLHHALKAAGIENRTHYDSTMDGSPDEVWLTIGTK